MEGLEHDAVSMDVAVSEVNKWLDYKKIKTARREALRPFVDILVDTVKEGQLVLNDNNGWDYKLNFPIDSINQISFKARINDAQLEQYKRGVKDADAFERSNTIMLLGLTGQPLGVLRALDTTDKSVADAIAIFFQ